MKRLDLKSEVNLNKKFILILVLVCVLTIGLYTSYAYFQITVIQNNVVVLQTASIDIITNIEGYDNPSFTLNSGESKTITVNLSSTADGDIAYKMYYIMTSGEATFEVTSTTSFTNDIVEGEMNKTETIVFTFENTGDSTITITLGTQGGLKEYPITLEQGTELVLGLGQVENSSDFKELVISNDTSSCPTYVEEDGITYISGSKDCIDFNYVWYSGKLWRITAIYPDGTMKMITDDAITNISYGSNINFYTNVSNSSYMYQWLNEDFLSTLYNYQNVIITNSRWNATQTNSTNSKLSETTMVTATVGLLNSYEYYKSYQNTSYSNGYLNIGYYWWLLNPYSSSDVWGVHYRGSFYHTLPSSAYGVRPSINLQSGITINGGTGTSEDPYTISGDKETVTAGTMLLNTRTSGEYVNFDGELYRIVGIENNTTKLNKMDYVRDSDNAVITKNFSSSATFGSGYSDTYWDYYLNNTWHNSISETYKNMLVEGTYYLGTISSITSSNYKGAICATASNTVTTADCEKTSSTWTGYVGLPRYGEMFANQQGSGYSSSRYIWLITPYSSDLVWFVDYDGNATSNPLRYPLGARPSINLSSAVKITGGTGLKNDPFEISL